MFYLRRAQQRGQAQFGWLHSQHTFSFGHYYDEQHMGFSVLRVINDDVVQPGYGFEPHRHRDMEIISYVIDGELEHRDSQGNQSVIPPGDIQRMSASSGIQHSEFNASLTETVNFLQIWVEPEKLGVMPSYAQKTVEQQEPLTALVTPDGAKDSISINQNMSLSRLVLEKGQSLELPVTRERAYLHLIKGELTSPAETLYPGDGLGIEQRRALAVSATKQVEALWFDLP
ncbi:pirin family protein [Salinimonas marina]|uniref:Pirin family protein n=1 Tax=Salinimonas marina TaxID=2785918 RepID=A0A7S9E078_9ALTE|nr:pirin family protein [Salinimonas marina]QPG06918.1 pirin family protein [Salinimonas marina]